MILRGPVPEAETADDSWRYAFYVHAFLRVAWANHHVERRELVWIKRFFLRYDRPHFYDELLRRLNDKTGAKPPTTSTAEHARRHMTMAEARNCVYNLAQMCKSKGHIDPAEYDSILAIGEELGVADTESDAIINSVFSIDETFAAIVGMLALGAILYFARDVIIPLVIAIFVAMVIHRVELTLVTRLRLRRLRPFSKLLAMVLVLGLLFAVVFAAIRSGRDVTARLPFYQDKGLALLSELNAAAQAHGIDWLAPRELKEQLAKVPLGAALSSLLGSLIRFVGNVVLVAVFAGFFVFSRGSERGVLQEMNDKITAYITIKSASSLLTGALVVAIAWAFGLDFALFWGTLAFLLNYIPSVGSIIASAAPILLAIVQFESLTAATGVAACLITTQLIIGQLLEPKLMGKTLAVKPVAILLGLIFWGYLWGIPGMFLAAPLMALLRILASYFNFSRHLERLLAADAEHP